MNWRSFLLTTLVVNFSCGNIQEKVEDFSLRNFEYETQNINGDSLYLKLVERGGNDSIELKNFRISIKDYVGLLEHEIGAIDSICEKASPFTNKRVAVNDYLISNQSEKILNQEKTKLNEVILKLNDEPALVKMDTVQLLKMPVKLLKMYLKAEIDQVKLKEFEILKTKLAKSDRQ